jgi:type I restriction enzyme M protein
MPTVRKLAPPTAPAESKDMTQSSFIAQPTNGTANGKVSQAEINAILWKACDTFRGTIDPSEYKNYILVMLFLKYISDVWAEHYAQLRSQHGDDDGRIRRQLRYERFVLPENCDYYTLYEQRNAANVGELINMALEAIEEANKEKLDGVFRNIDFNSESALGRTAQRNERLKHLLEDFHDPRLDMRPSRIGNLDVIGNAYEYLIGKFASDAGKKAGEFYTPPEVSLLLAELLDPQPGDRICDPACGSGSLLIKCAQRVGGGDYAAYGQEANGATWALCMMNMFLHNINVTIDNIKWTDTLKEPRLTTDSQTLMRFNVVVANPPFSLDKWGAENACTDRFRRFWRGVPPASKGDYAFISHMIETTYLDPTERGRVGVVVPHGVLFRGGAEGRIRQQLIDENLLDAVIGLPENLFYGTGIPAAILIFRRDRRDDCVLFIDASHDYQQGSNQNYLRDDDRIKVLRTYHERESVAKYAYLATREEIAANDYNLNIPRYVDTFEQEEQIDLAVVNASIMALRAQLGELEGQMQAYLEELGL